VLLQRREEVELLLQFARILPILRKLCRLLMSGSEGATKKLSQLSLSDSASLERGASRKVQNDAFIDSDLNLSRHAADPHAGASGPAAACDVEGRNIEFVDYQDESQLPAVMSLVGRDLSEPYSSTFLPAAFFTSATP
jgi:hypothetical protein